MQKAERNILNVKALTRVMLFMWLILYGCLSPLERYENYKGGQVVISGQVSTIGEANVVFVGWTSSRERIPEPILGAFVVLIDDMGEVQGYSEDPVVPGAYTLSSFEGRPGRTYFLRVTLPDGRVYESSRETMPVNIGEDSIYYLFQAEQYVDGEGTIAERTFLKIFSNNSLPSAGEPVYLKWHVEEVYMLSPTDFPDPFGNIPPPCYIAQYVDPQRIVLFDTENKNIETLTDLEVATRLLDPTFKERHYFTIYHSSLTKNAYEYWQNVDIVANQTGSIFDQPPARVRGNLRNITFAQEEVFGYFQAVNQRFERFYTLPDDLPYRLTEYCEYRNDRPYTDYPSECLDCLSKRNSSYRRPPWF